MAKDRDRDRDEKPKGKARGGFSVRSKDAVDVGLFSSGPAHIKESCWADYTYRGSAKAIPVWLITYTREGEEPYEQPYGIGKGWKVGKGGNELVARAGQTGLARSCNAMKYLIVPLEKALKAAGMEVDDYLGDANPRALEGLDVIVERRDQEKREGLPDRKDGQQRSILVPVEVVEEGATGKKKGKTRDAGEEEDEDEDTEKDENDDDDDDDDDEDDEKPAAKGKKTVAKDDDEEEGEDEAPSKAKSKGKAAAAADDDADLEEEGVEALIAALEANDSTLTLRALPHALDVELKGNPQRKAIIALMTDTDTLGLEKGWTFNERKKTVTLD